MTNRREQEAGQKLWSYVAEARGIRTIQLYIYTARGAAVRANTVPWPGHVLQKRCIPCVGCVSAAWTAPPAGYATPQHQVLRPKEGLSLLAVSTHRRCEHLTMSAMERTVF